MYGDLVSIIIPSYNVERYISRGINSCINQTYKNIEIIVVDDGSTDGTLDVINRMSCDPRIKVFSKENGGVSSARNFALNLSKGDYCLFLDSDDWLEPETVEVLVAEINKKKSDLICADRYFAYFNEDGSIRKENQAKENIVKYISQKDGLLHLGTGIYSLQSSCYKLFKKAIIEEHNIRFKEELYHGEDGLFVFEYLNKIDGFVYISKALWNILERPGSATTSEYNSKWLSMIDAIDYMINSSLDSEVISKLMTYKAERALILFRTYCKGKKRNRNDEAQIRKIMREMKPYYSQNGRRFIERIKYLFFSFTPIKIIRVLYMSCKKND